MKGAGNSYDFGARMLDPRIGRWMSVDPLATQYCSLSPYNFAANSPIICVDPDGEKIEFAIKGESKRKLKALIRRLKKSEVFRTVYKQLRKSSHLYTINVKDFGESSIDGSFVGRHGTPDSKLVYTPINYEENEEGEIVEVFGEEVIETIPGVPIDQGGGLITIGMSLFSQAPGYADAVVAEELIHAFQYDTENPTMNEVNSGPTPNSREREFEAKGITGIVIEQASIVLPTGSSNGYIGEIQEVTNMYFDDFLSGKLTIQEATKEGLLGYSRFSSDPGFKAQSSKALDLHKEAEE